MLFLVLLDLLFIVKTATCCKVREKMRCSIIFVLEEGLVRRKKKLRKVEIDCAVNLKSTFCYLFAS